ncbi:MAG TPA: DUF4392 domain-containing protein [Gemmataceae bacterium]|jgi:hypothetical protein
MSDALLDKLREIIQQDVGNRGLARDPVDNLFTACRDDLADACRSIAEAPHAALAVVTGFPIVTGDLPFYNETDGPLGALFLARALIPLGIKVALICDPSCRRPLEIGFDACELRGATDVATLPARNHAWAAFLDRDWSPYRTKIPMTHLIALERVGPGPDDRCRNMRGRDITDETNPAHLLFEHAARRTPPLCTIGIGDGGNEIGMGKIPLDTICRNIPNGEIIACRVPTDRLIVAGVSNWGAYALAAGVAILRGRRLPSALFDIERERELLRVMVEEGPLVDGITTRPTVSVDGLSFEDYIQPLRRMGELLGSEDG